MGIINNGMAGYGSNGQIGNPHSMGGMPINPPFQPGSLNLGPIGPLHGIGNYGPMGGMGMNMPSPRGMGPGFPGGNIGGFGGRGY